MVIFGCWHPKIVAHVLLLGLSRFFLYAVVHMVPTLFSGHIMADAPQRPIILGVMMADAMVRCLADAAVAPKIH